MNSDIGSRPKPEILVVDDDPALLQMLEYALRDKYDVITVISGEKAFEILETMRPDLIILDIMMSGLNGFEICTRLKQQREFTYIPIIMLTALDADSDHIIGMKTGANFYMTKPFELKTLITKIEEQLQRAEKFKKNEWIQDWMEFTIKNELKYLEEINDLIEQIHIWSDLDKNTVIELNIAIREIITNAFEHGNLKDPEKSVFVSYMRVPDKLFIRIEDMGAGFDVNVVEDPMTERNFFKDRGRGIFITRQVMDEIYFSSPRQPLEDEILHLIPQEERNRSGQIVLLVKHLSAHNPRS